MRNAWEALKNMRSVRCSSAPSTQIVKHSFIIALSGSRSRICVFSGSLVSVRVFRYEENSLHHLVDDELELLRRFQVLQSCHCRWGNLLFCFRSHSTVLGKSACLVVATVPGPLAEVCFKKCVFHQCSLSVAVATCSRVGLAATRSHSLTLSSVISSDRSVSPSNSSALESVLAGSWQYVQNASELETVLAGSWRYNQNTSKLESVREVMQCRLQLVEWLASETRRL